ncbi:MAG TPA: barstar family protein [Polyangia bacterium]|jgi:RNAse (barnase) inhibitor barstar|nr:barstar family protein [Polyangia bacterium]
MARIRRSRSDAATVAAELAAAGVAVVARLDGAAARDKPRFMAAVARALQFPDYFGGNWDAFDECLAELQWQNRSIVLVVDHAADLLIDAPNHLQLLMMSIDDSFRANAELPQASFEVVLIDG